MMRAKFKVTKVTPYGTPQTSESIEMMAVTDKPFDKDGNSEDNSFAKWTPSGALTMSFTNPNLFGKLKVDDKYYLDFTKSEK